MLSKDIVLKEPSSIFKGKTVLESGENKSGNTETVQERNRLFSKMVSISSMRSESMVAGKEAAQPASTEIRKAATPAVGNAVEPSNSQPNGAYQIGFDVFYQDSISGAGVRRWYYFELTEKKKITLYMSPENDGTIDNDLALYRLDTTTGQLTEVAKSQNNAGAYELLGYIGEAGIYFFCVAAYAGNRENLFSFTAHLSDSWDAYEGNDNLYQARLQGFNAPVRQTIDNAFDEDFSVIHVAAAGDYAVSLFDVPENCSYVLDLMDANQNILATIDKNTSNRRTLQVGAYILRLRTTGTFSAEAQVSVLVTNIPSSVNEYAGWMTEDKKHFVEVMSGSREGEGRKIYAVCVDGASVDYKSIDFTTTRTNTSVSNSECSITTTQDSNAVGIAIGHYDGINSCENALLIKLDTAVYGESHWKKSYDFSEMQGANSVLTGTDKYHKTYYSGSWSAAKQSFGMGLIFDMDSMQPVDFKNPNWYHGSPSCCGYGLYGGAENAYFTFTNRIGALGDETVE